MRLFTFFTSSVLFVFIFLLSGNVTADEAINPSLAQVDSLYWYDIRHLDVEGRGWTDTKEFYDRLPAKAEGVVRKPVWSLSRDSAGMCARFVTDATTIHTRWVLRSEGLAMSHMPATGVSGIDLYAKSDKGLWRWVAVGRPENFPTNSVQLLMGIPE